jgi:hypothetical protein
MTLLPVFIRPVVPGGPSASLVWNFRCHWSLSTSFASPGTIVCPFPTFKSFIVVVVQSYRGTASFPPPLCNGTAIMTNVSAIVHRRPLLLAPSSTVVKTLSPTIPTTNQLSIASIVVTIFINIYWYFWCWPSWGSFITALPCHLLWPNKKIFSCMHEEVVSVLNGSYITKSTNL